VYIDLSVNEIHIAWTTEPC